MKIKRNLSSIFTRICAFGLAILGFGCSDESGGLMYGTPTGTFEIKGEVTDEENKPVEGAEVRVTYPDAPSSQYSFQTVKTNSNGDYQTKCKETAFDRVKVVVVPDNNDLEADSTIVELKYKKEPGNKDSWYVGEAEATVDFKLKNKKAE